MEYNIEVVPAIHSNLKLLFIECYPIKEEFLMPWTLTDITYEISQRKYIVTNSADYDKYSDIVKRGNDSNLLIVFYVQIMPDDFVMQLHRF